MEAKKYLCLCDLPLFSGLQKDSFGLVCGNALKRVLQKGEFLFRQGDAADTVYIIKEGSFKQVRLSENGEEVIVAISGIGDLIGECTLFEDCGVQPVSAVALEASRVCSLSREVFEQLILRDPDFALQLIRSLSNRLYRTWERPSSSARQAREKILSVLLSLSEDHGEVCAEGIRICVPLTQQDLADLSGFSRVTVSQVLSGLIEEALLLKDGKHYILRNRCF